MDEVLVPVCAPEFKEHHGFNSIRDVDPSLIIDHVTRDPNLRRGWQERFGLTTGASDSKYEFEHVFLFLEALRQGMGLAIVPEIIVSEDLRTKRLTHATKERFSTGESYWLVGTKMAFQRAPVRNFTDWVTSQMTSARSSTQRHAKQA